MISIPRLIMDTGQNKSAPDVNIVPTIGAHIAALKSNLRPEDAAEVLQFGVTINKALWYSYRMAAIRKTALIDGEVAACWGCNGGLLGNKAVPWLMTTPLVHKVSPLKFTRIYINEVNEMLKIFPILSNYVDAKYSSAIRMLENAGFILFEPEPIGSYGALYRRFEIRA